MSLINQLNATTDYFWLQTDPEDILNKASALLWKLFKNAKNMENWEIQNEEIVDGGLMVKVPLEYQASNHGSYGATTVINQSKVSIIDAARFRWAGAYGSNTLNLDDKTQNSGDAAVVRLAQKYIKSIKKSIRVDMASQVIAAAADDDSINGAGDLFNADSSVEYGSIAEDDMSTWGANVITTGEAISYEVMQKIWREPNMGSHEGALPDFCCTTQLLVDGYKRSLHPQQRYSNGNMVEAGWKNILHDGAPIVADSYYSTGVLDAFNLRFLSLRAHKDYNFTTPVWLSKAILGQPDTLTADTRWRGNLFCTNRNMQVRHTGLTEPV